MQECDRDWVDALLWGVRPGVGMQLPGEAKVDFPQDVHTGVVVPHAGENLCYIAEVVLHGAILDACSVLHQSSHRESV